MIGAVSPAVRDTSRMTPVRMPLIEFGSTIAANRLPARRSERSSSPRETPGAPPGATRGSSHDDHGEGHHRQGQAGGEDARAELGRRCTNAPTPKSACTIDGTPARLMMARLMRPGEPVVAGVLAEVEGRGHPERHGGERAPPRRARSCRPGRGSMPPAVMPSRRVGEQELPRDQRRAAASHQDGRGSGRTGITRIIALIQQEEDLHEADLLDSSRCASVQGGRLEHGVSPSSVGSSGAGRCRPSRLMVKVTRKSRMPRVKRAR